MNLRILVVSVLLSAIGCISALALAPMGPPTATLKTGQSRFGLDFSTSQADIEADWGDGFVDTLKDVQSNLFAANIGYGICDDWEIFVRLGGANADYDKYENGGVTYNERDFSGNYGFLFGLGTKVTWAKQENINWGALFQIHWLTSESSWEEPDGAIVWDVSHEMNMHEIQVSVGPTWMVNETLSIYGGPFLHFIGGDINEDWTIVGTGSGSDSAGLKEESCLGGYVGAQLELDTNASVYAEFQFTSDAWAFGTGIGWRI
jgi:hypothetical protein